MNNKVYFILCSILLCTMSNSHACDPIALDWQRLYQDYDKNQNKMIEKSEWQQLIQLKNQPYAFTQRADQTDPFRLKIFQQLDTNRNGALSEDELSGIYAYFPNPCEGWGITWAVETPQQLWWQKLLDRLRSLW